MSRVGKAVALSCLVMFGATGCSTIPRSPGLPAEGQIPLETRVGNERVHLLRSYVDDVKTPEGESRRRFDIVWNYTRGITQQFAYDMDGVLIDVTDLSGMMLTATAAEKAWARRILAADPRTAAVSDPAVTMSGGFIHFADSGNVCRAGSRCLRMFGVRDQGRHVVFHVYVDLALGRVVATDVDPEFRGIGDRPESKK